MSLPKVEKLKLLKAQHDQSGLKYFYGLFITISLGNQKFQGNSITRKKSKAATAMKRKTWIQASFPFKSPDLSF